MFRSNGEHCGVAQHTIAHANRTFNTVVIGLPSMQPGMYQRR
jgi:hypothetical protein